jgi:hypothetical protein
MTCSGLYCLTPALPRNTRRKRSPPDLDPRREDLRLTGHGHIGQLNRRNVVHYVSVRGEENRQPCLLDRPALGAELLLVQVTQPPPASQGLPRSI